ncbi:MAG: hypothetical protein PUF72_01910 [Clostridiales bacterium]|nr:hypothetical protein [Clostridiales bacterium]
MGIVLYIYFLFIGFLIANRLFEERDLYYRAWMGGIFGNVLLMAGIVPFAFVFGFSIVAHILLALFAGGAYVLMTLKQKKPLIKINRGGEGCIDIKILSALILPITLVIWILMTNHILTPVQNGSVASGQCTYGDLQMHLGFVTSIAQQKTFPPQYPFLAGEKLNYPFFADMLSSSLYLFGVPLRWAVLVPSYVISLLLVGGFYIFAYTITKRKSAAVLATVFFFINGGFGFAYFMEGAKADSTAFTRIFTDYYHTPTNYNEMNIRWSDTICDMIIPQRTTMVGWCVLLPCLTLLYEAVKASSRRLFIILGVLAGCMPMIHTHSFLGLGIISGVMLIVCFAGAGDKKKYITDWACYGVIALAIAMPQLFYWTFSQTSGNSSFLNYHFNWVNENDPYLWFYIKNWGIAFLLALPAFINTSRDNKRLFAAGAVIFALAEFVQFQPNEYDNNKLFYITYMITLVIVSELLVMLYDKLKGVKWRAYFAVLVIAAGTVSGALTIGREWKSGGDYRTFTQNDIKMAEYIKDNVPADEVVLTGTGHLNPVVTLAGRTVYVGSSLYVYFHGFTSEYSSRKAEVEEAYSSYSELVSFCRDKNISYVYVSDNERDEFSLNENAVFASLEPVYTAGNNKLYYIK